MCKSRTFSCKMCKKIFLHFYFILNCEIIIWCTRDSILPLMYKRLHIAIGGYTAFKHKVKISLVPRVFAWLDMIEDMIREPHSSWVKNLKFLFLSFCATYLKVCISISLQTDMWMDMWVYCLLSSLPRIQLSSTKNR